MTRNKWIAVSVGIILVAFFMYGNTFINLFNPQNNQPKMEQTTGVTKEDVIVGQGAEAQAGDMITVHYVGTLTSGQVFDSSRDRNQPFNFTLGAGQVIKGWDEGVAGMKVGGKRRLVISPDYGYGASAVGPIPPNSTLIFEVELLDVVKTVTQ